jgi:hypothetical protein
VIDRVTPLSVLDEVARQNDDDARELLSLE